MITSRRATERQHDQRRTQEAWHTFELKDRADALNGGFGALKLLSEDRLPPRAAVPRRPPCNAEVVTYVREGALSYQDSAGRSGGIQAGEFQRMTPGAGFWHSAKNASRTGWAHVFQLWLRAGEGDLEPGYEQRRFPAAERRGALCVVASPDGRKGSLRIRQDALLYSAMLDPGQHVVHELRPGRSAWLHIVEGAAAVGDVRLITGDGVGINAERAVSLTAEEETEFLLLDLREELSGQAANCGVA